MKNVIGTISYLYYFILLRQYIKKFRSGLQPSFEKIQPWSFFSWGGDRTCWNPDPEALLFGIDSRALHADGLYFRGSKREFVYLGWPIAPSYMSPNAGGGGGGCGVSANEYSCPHGAQINFGDLTSPLVYTFAQELLAEGGCGQGKGQEEEQEQEQELVAAFLMYLIIVLFSYCNSHP